jgi:hypothetical protein
MKVALLLMLVSLNGHAQDSIWNTIEPTRIFVAYREATLVAAAEVVTIQQPATAPANVWFDGLSVYCSVACAFTLERNGTAATATEITPAAITPGLAAKAKAFHGSDVGTGTVIARYVVPAGATVPVSVRGMKLRWNGGTGENLTIRTDAISGDVKILVRWGEIL